MAYALKPRVEADLDRLESAGVITKVEHCEWGTPIVPVPKKDGTVRVCGDFKVTVNPNLEPDRYPVPKVDDMLANLANGQKFSKIDLANAYLQLELDDEGEEILTISTHKGLYKFNHIPYGITSAPTIFQCCPVAWSNCCKAFRES